MSKALQWYSTLLFMPPAQLMSTTPATASSGAFAAACGITLSVAGTALVSLPGQRLPTAATAVRLPHVVHHATHALMFLPGGASADADSSWACSVLMLEQ